MKQIELENLTKEQLLEEWHKVRKDLSRTLDTIDTMEKFNALKNCYLLPTFEYLQNIGELIDRM